jgi:signal transduction histidine kinase
VPRRIDLLWTALAVAVALAGVQLGASDATRVDGATDLLGALLVVGACVPMAVRRSRPVAAAVAAMPLACLALALGYTVIVPVLIGLALCSWAVFQSERRVTVPLAAYAGTMMAPSVAITADGTPLGVRLLGGFAIGVAAVLIGDAVRNERERTREAQRAAQRITELRDRDVERAVVEERLRIARDVHDITGHHLSAISLQAAGAGRRTTDPVARAALERIHGLTSEALGQTRRTLGVLRESDPAQPARPATRAPAPRLEHVDDLLRPARDAGLEVDLRMDAPVRPLSDEIEVCAYRVVQEALTNVIRHARAHRVRVEIAYGERELLIGVDDDGAGGPGAPGGGVQGMRERVAIVGGTFAAGPSGRGWSVRASLPLDVERAAGDEATLPGGPEEVRR